MLFSGLFPGVNKKILASLGKRTTNDSSYGQPVVHYNSDVTNLYHRVIDNLNF
jgi:hypothetical protein